MSVFVPVPFNAAWFFERWCTHLFTATVYTSLHFTQSVNHSSKPCSDELIRPSPCCAEPYGIMMKTERHVTCYWKPVLYIQMTLTLLTFLLLESQEHFIPVPDGSVIKFVLNPIIICKAFTWIETAAKLQLNSTHVFVFESVYTRWLGFIIAV